MLNKSNLIISRIYWSNHGPVPLPNTINITAQIPRPEPDLLQKLVVFPPETHLCKFHKSQRNSDSSSSSYTHPISETSIEIIKQKREDYSRAFRECYWWLYRMQEKWYSVETLFLETENKCQYGALKSETKRNGYK